MHDNGASSSDDRAFAASPSSPAVSPVPASIPSADMPVFVFGSNLAGRHGKGAALWARQHRGAIYGQGHGIQGDSYAIPTKGHRLETLPLSMVEGFVSEFLMFARKYWFRQFQLTPIGCGLAGFKREQIEPLFRGAPDNIIWPPEWSAASAIEARRAETGTGSVHESAVGTAETPKDAPDA